jgi:hypothetical protein
VAESKSAWLFNDFKEHLKKCQKKCPWHFQQLGSHFQIKRQPPAGESVLQNFEATGCAPTAKRLRRRSIGATGARLIVTLLHALEARNLKRGVAALCIGGGEATAIAVERAVR